MKIIITALVFLLGANVFAMGRDQDYSTSIYGSYAAKIFKLVPKLTKNCGYANASPEDEGNLGKDLNTLINDKKINSVLCMQIGEKTFACEASTLWYSSPCGT